MFEGIKIIRKDKVIIDAAVKNQSEATIARVTDFLFLLSLRLENFNFKTETWAYVHREEGIVFSIFDMNEAKKGNITYLFSISLREFSGENNDRYWSKKEIAPIAQRAIMDFALADKVNH